MKWLDETEKYLTDRNRNSWKNKDYKLRIKKKIEKTYRIKTNNQELLIRKQNESDATS